MPNLTLVVEGPRPSTRRISANYDGGAVLLAKLSIEADYGHEGDPAVLQANMTLTSDAGSHPDDTVAQMLSRQVPP